MTAVTEKLPAAVAGQTTPPRPRAYLRDGAIGGLFLAPSLALLAFLVVYPFAMLVYNSFYRYSVMRPAQPAEFVGLDNYAFLISDEYTWERFSFTGTYVLIAVGIQFLLGIGVGYLLQNKFRGRDLLFTLMLVPMMLSPIVVGLFWKYLFNTQWGLINVLLSPFGGAELEWLANPNLSLWAVVIADTWMWTPFIILLATAAFSGVPKTLYEAAAVDGASASFRFFHITLPLSAPILMIALLLRLIDSLKQFDLFYALTGGGPGDSTQTISFTLYKTAFQYFYTGEASALAVIILVMIIALSLIFVRYLTGLAERSRG